MVKRVSVYVSDFGAERLEKEATLGPQAIWKEQDEQEARERSEAASDEDPETARELEEVRLRKYELEKFSYYFAVAECDNLSTANTLYDQLNGIEVGYSSVQLDLRYDNCMSVRRLMCFTAATNGHCVIFARIDSFLTM